MLVVNRLRFGLNLAEARRAAGFSAWETARQVGVSLTNYQRWERGLGSPSLDSLAALCVVLGCSVSDLLSETVEQEPDGPEDGPRGAA